MMVIKMMTMDFLILKLQINALLILKPERSTGVHEPLGSEKNMVLLQADSNAVNESKEFPHVFLHADSNAVN